ncbi:hypothetical protein Ac2012v2_007061 [Leucoagaricus gongylophorus]
MVAFKFLACAASVIGLVAAQDQGLSITLPASNLWWVAKSANTLTWTCRSSPFTNFTVIMTNTNPSVLSGPQAFISIQQNTDCSKLVTQEQSDYSPSTGYRILLANTLNQTDIYAQSDEFEIKPLGSAYPMTSSPADATSATSSGSATAAASSTSGNTSGATSLETLGLGLSAGIAAGIAYLT